MRKRESASQTTLFSSKNKRQESNIKHLKEKLNISLHSLALARQLSEDVGTWGIHIERHRSRLSPDSWWLDLNLHDSEEYPCAPDINDYGIGCYRNHDPRIDEFIKARARWILPQLEEEARSFLFELKNQEAAGRRW